MLSVSQLSTHAYQTHRETEICEQQRIIIISVVVTLFKYRTVQTIESFPLFYFYFFYGGRPRKEDVIIK